MSNNTPSTNNAATVEADVSKELATFQARYPLRSKTIEGRSWVFRQTPGKSAEQCPIVMLPGIQGGGDIFFETALALGEVLPLITVSAPDIEDATEMVAETAGFLAALNTPRVNIVGSSLGGYLAQKFALDFPNQVEQLAIANGFFDIEPLRSNAPLVSSFAEMDAAAIVEKNVGELLNSPSVDLDPYDVISFPPGVPRAFENLTPTLGEEEGLIVAIVAGDAPISEAMPGVKQLLMSSVKGDLPTMGSEPNKTVLMTTKNGGFGG
jgi:pimeloyl-ACP methyl ester carboxylesterase